MSNVCLSAKEVYVIYSVVNGYDNEDINQRYERIYDLRLLLCIG